MSRSLSNFFSGFGSILNLFPIDTTMHLPSSAPRTDEEAIRGDWSKIGGDFQTAVDKTVGAHGKAEQTQPRPQAIGSSR